MLGSRRAGTTGTPWTTTLAQGTWVPWTATIGTTTTSGSANTRAAWFGLERHRLQRGGEGEAAVPQPPGWVEPEAAARIAAEPDLARLNWTVETTRLAVIS
jgi:hypothetical protein